MKKRLDLKRLLFNISSLVDLGQEVTSSKELQDKIRTALYVVTGMFSVPRAALFLQAAESRSLALLAVKGLEKTACPALFVSQEEIASLPRNAPVPLRDLRRAPFTERNRALLERLHAHLFVPLFAKGEFVGALVLGKRLGRTSYLQNERDVLKVIAHQMAITLHHANLFQELTKKVDENKRLYENMRHMYHDTIRAFAAAIDAKDEYTKNHSSRVARYAVAIARELGWRDKDVEGLYVAGLLHDIGKIVIDRDVINKGSKLTPRERNEIKRHPEVSYDILTKIRLPWKDAVTFIRHHHERPDGRGYPDSLAGTELSDGAKILALADAFDAMTTDRPYREKLSLAEALQEIKNCVGTQFDDRISRIFFNLLEREINGVGRKAQILPHVQRTPSLSLDMPDFGYDA